MSHLEDLLQVFLKNGIKISPRKCQLFELGLQYMDNTFYEGEMGMCQANKV